MLGKAKQIFAASILHRILIINLLFRRCWIILIEAAILAAAFWWYFCHTKVCAPCENTDFPVCCLVTMNWETRVPLHEQMYRFVSHMLVILCPCFTTTSACPTHLPAAGAWGYLKVRYETHHQGVKKMRWGMGTKLLVHVAQFILNCTVTHGT